MGSVINAICCIKGLIFSMIIKILSFIAMMNTQMTSHSDLSPKPAAAVNYRILYQFGL